MFIELPIKFDSNEIYILASLLLVSTISVFLPKRFSLAQVVYFLTFNFFLGVVVDQILAVPPYDYYDIMDLPKMDIMDIVIYLLVYPITSYLFFYILDGIKNKVAGVLFIMIWCFFVLGLEWLGSKLGVYKYSNWSFYLSFFSYVIIFSLNTAIWYLVKQNSRIKNY